VKSAVSGLLAVAALAALSGHSWSSNRKLPEIGTQLEPLPEGTGKALADNACLRCHSSDILRQQRLTSKQWSATVEKMVRWGAEVSDEDKAALIAYLFENFGPGNDRFSPTEAAPPPRR